MLLQSGYDRSKNPQKQEYRHLTFEEFCNLDSVSHVQFVDRHGRVRDAKVNSKVKRWKRRPNDAEVSLKYGMYEYFTAEYRDGKPYREELVTLA